MNQKIDVESLLFDLPDDLPELLPENENSIHSPCFSIGQQQPEQNWPVPQTTMGSATFQNVNQVSYLPSTTGIDVVQYERQRGQAPYPIYGVPRMQTFYEVPDNVAVQRQQQSSYNLPNHQQSHVLKAIRLPTGSNANVLSLSNYQYHASQPLNAQKLPTILRGSRSSVTLGSANAIAFQQHPQVSPMYKKQTPILTTRPAKMFGAQRFIHHSTSLSNTSQALSRTVVPRIAYHQNLSPSTLTASSSLRLSTMPIVATPVANVVGQHQFRHAQAFNGNALRFAVSSTATNGQSIRFLNPSGNTVDSKSVTILSSNGMVLYQTNTGGIEFEDDDDKMEQTEAYNEYVAKYVGGRPHPDVIVESSSLASVGAPPITQDLSLPTNIVREGLLSSAQLDAIALIMKRHEKFLPDGRRAAFLLGDGPGVGKGRIIAGTIVENWLNRRRRILWVSMSNDLKADAERDLSDLGFSKIRVYNLGKLGYGKLHDRRGLHVRKGVLFCTYSSLIAEKTKNEGRVHATRLEQILRWLKKDSMIVLDECHRCKNWGGAYEKSASSSSSKTAEKVQELLHKKKYARLVFASATGASEPQQLAYMQRLGLWGFVGAPFPEGFEQFRSIACQAEDLLSSEMIAMFMKEAGMYLARQLTFRNVLFNVHEVDTSKLWISGTDSQKHELCALYDDCTVMFTNLVNGFREAIRLMDVGPEEKLTIKMIISQMWSAHQRFFKHLCISAKVPDCVRLTEMALRSGKATGESRFLDAMNEKSYHNTLSCSAGVLMNLLEKYFPSRENLNRLKDDRFTGGPMRKKCGVSTPRQNGGTGRMDTPGLLGIRDMLGEDEVNLVLSQSHRNLYGRNRMGAESSPEESEDSADSSADEVQVINKKGKRRIIRSTNNHMERSGKRSKRSGFDLLDDDENDMDEDDNGTDEKFSSSDDDDYDPDNWELGDLPSLNNIMEGVGNGGNQAILNGKRRKKPTTFRLDSMNKESEYGFGSGDSQQKSRLVFLAFNTLNENVKLMSKEERQRAADNIYEQLIYQAQELSKKLPKNALDELIEKMGGPCRVAEMTGRKKRPEVDITGNVTLVSRCEDSTDPTCTMETVNISEKDAFMNGQKLVAIISEAASSGISLQSDRRVRNQRQRLHITLEMPWSAEKAIQQFGRTHRSNQACPPEYLFLISDLAGERRFASTVVKRMESLGALMQGDRRASDMRNLNKFSVDNPRGQTALDRVLKSIEEDYRSLPKELDELTDTTQEKMPPNRFNPGVPYPNACYSGGWMHFILDAYKGLANVKVLGKDTNAKVKMTTFLNRLLGLPIRLQAAVFQYFTRTLDAVLEGERRCGKLDMGIMDLNISLKSLEKVHEVFYTTEYLAQKMQFKLLTVRGERGMSWREIYEVYESEKHHSSLNGFYKSTKNYNGGKIMVWLLLKARSVDGKDFFTLYRPHDGKLPQEKALSSLKHFEQLSDLEAIQQHWSEIFAETEKQCIHQYLGLVSCPHRRLGGRRTKVSMDVTVPGIQGCTQGSRLRHYVLLVGSSSLNILTRLSAELRAKLIHKVRFHLPGEPKSIGMIVPEDAIQSLQQSLDRLNLEKATSNAPTVINHSLSTLAAQDPVLSTGNTGFYTHTSSLKSQPIAGADQVQIDTLRNRLVAVNGHYFTVPNHLNKFGIASSNSVSSASPHEEFHGGNHIPAVSNISSLVPDPLNDGRSLSHVNNMMRCDHYAPVHIESRQAGRGEPAKKKRKKSKRDRSPPKIRFDFVDN